MSTTLAAPDLGDKVTLFEKARTESLRNKRLTLLVGGLLFVGVFLVSMWIGRVDVTKLRDLPAMWNYIKDTIPTLRAPYLAYDLGRWFARGHIWAEQIVDTILIAILSTAISTAAAFVMCFPASRNLMRNWPVYFFFRRLLDLARAIPTLVYALIFVFAFELGALPGVLAIAIHSAGSLGKLFSEVNENVEVDSIEGIRSTGGNWFQIIRYAVVPQVLPNFVSYAILRLEINIRAATVIGLVGAGGIGMELMFAIRQFQYTDISAITLMIIILVVILDRGCEVLRHRIIGKEALL